MEEQTRDLLESLRDSLNYALQNENKNIKEHVAHPEFHFDYIDSEVSNAIAFQSSDRSFIGITLPLVFFLWDLCMRLSRSPDVRRLLGDSMSDQWESAHIVFFRCQLNFIVSHEYTHHVHGHIAKCMSILEMRSGQMDSIKQQAQEVDADGYAAYFFLAHMFGEEGKPHNLQLLGLTGATADTQNQVLLSAFVIAVAAFFFATNPASSDKSNLYQLSHPPQIVRMEFLMRGVKSWASQNIPALAEWMTVTRYQELTRVVSESTVGPDEFGAWAKQMAILMSSDGTRYLRDLDLEFRSQVQQLGASA